MKQGDISGLKYTHERVRNQLRTDAGVAMQLLYCRLQSGLIIRLIIIYNIKVRFQLTVENHTVGFLQHYADMGIRGTAAVCERKENQDSVSRNCLSRDCLNFGSLLIGAPKGINASSLVQWAISSPRKKPKTSLTSWNINSNATMDGRH